MQITAGDFPNDETGDAQPERLRSNPPTVTGGPLAACDVIVEIKPISEDVILLLWKSLDPPPQASLEEQLAPESWLQRRLFMVCLALPKPQDPQSELPCWL